MIREELTIDERPERKRELVARRAHYATSGRKEGLLLRLLRGPVRLNCITGAPVVGFNVTGYHEVLGIQKGRYTVSE